MTNNSAKMANVLSIAENMQKKKIRRDRKASLSQPHESAQLMPHQQPQAIATPVEPETRAVAPVSGQSQIKGIARGMESEVDDMENLHLFSVKQLEKIGVVHPKTSNRALVDSLRQLRTKLFQLQPDGNFTVLVTSVVPEGGASFVALNLASTITFDRAKTSLLIDANINDPVLHRILKLLKLKPQFGLLDYLASPEIGIDKIVCQSGIKRMRIIPIGESEEGLSEQLTSRRMPGFLKNVKQRYDNRFIVIDAPCISSSADTRVLADHVDFIILVAPYGVVTTSQIDTIVDDIDERKLAGIVINNEPLL